MIEQLTGVSGRSVSRETVEQVQRYAALLEDEAQRQNLVSRATIDSLWVRHIFDSAQLVRFEPARGASWLDIGSGAGLPGIIVALLVEGPVTLVEPRRLRAEFLARAVAELSLADRVSVFPGKVERTAGSYDVITARAVASVDKLLELSTHLSTRKTLWVLPKGRSAESELADARRSWHCDAEIVPSRTDPESRILLLRNVRARGGR